MKASIPASAIGNFSSLEQKRLYDKMTRIMEPVKETADQFIRCDNLATDANTRAGSVLLDGAYTNSNTYSGLCQFDPATKQVKSMDVHVTHMDYSQVDPDADYVWNSSGRRPGESHYHHTVQQDAAGVTTWSGPQGSVHVTPDGSLFMDA